MDDGAPTMNLMATNQYKEKLDKKLSQWMKRDDAPGVGGASSSTASQQSEPKK